MLQHPRVQALALACALLGAAQPAWAAAGAPARVPVQIDRANNLQPLWRRPVVRIGAHRRVIDSLATPAISVRHKLVVVGTGEGMVMGVHIADGSVAWRRRYRAPLVSAAQLATLPLGAGAAEAAPSGDGGEDARAGLGDEVALMGASDGALLAVRVADGTLAWRTQLDVDIRARPTVAQGRVFVSSQNNRVLALQLADGHVLWSQGRAERPGLSLLGHARAAVGRGRVLATFSDGFVMAIGAERGEVLWSRPLSLQRASFVDADATAQLVGDQVFVASITDGVYALSADDGTTVWHTPVADVVSLAHTGALLFAADTAGHVHVLEPGSGKLRSHVALPVQPAGALTELGDALALTAGPAGLLLLSPTTGQPRGVQPLGGLPGGEIAHAGPYVAHLSRSGHLLLWAHSPGGPEA